MIERNEKGEAFKLTRIRVYAVSGFSNNVPFSGFNVWTDDGSVTQAQIEAYASFQGWATPELSIDLEDRSESRVPQKGEFRVGLSASRNFYGDYYPVLYQESGYSNLDPSHDSQFLRWLTPMLQFDVPAPVPVELVRFRAEASGGLVEGMLIATRKQLTAAFGKTANFGRPFGLTNDLLVHLEPQHFLVLSSNQEQVTRLNLCSDKGTLSGFNPLNHLMS